MIVKTGANYQDEGGYIEASRNGNEYTINGNTINDTYGVFSMASVTFRNRSSGMVTVYASSTTEALFYSRQIPAGGGSSWNAVFGGRMAVSLGDAVVDTDNSSGCVVEGPGYIRITEIDAEVVFVNA